MLQLVFWVRNYPPTFFLWVERPLFVFIGVASPLSSASSTSFCFASLTCSGFANFSFSIPLLAWGASLSVNTFGFLFRSVDPWPCLRQNGCRYLSHYCQPPLDYWSRTETIFLNDLHEDGVITFRTTCGRCSFTFLVWIILLWYDIVPITFISYILECHH